LLKTPALSSVLARFCLGSIRSQIVPLTFHHTQILHSLHLSLHAQRSFLMLSACDTPTAMAAARPARTPAQRTRPCIERKGSKMRFKCRTEKQETHRADFLLKEGVDLFLLVARGEGDVGDGDVEELWCEGKDDHKYALSTNAGLHTLQRGSQPSCTLKMRRRSAGMLSSGGEVSQTVQSGLKISHTLGFGFGDPQSLQRRETRSAPSAEVLVKAPKAHHSILAVPSILALIDWDTTLQPGPPLPPANGYPEHNHPVHKIVHAHDGRPRALHPLDGVTMSEHNLGIGVSPRELDVAV